MDEVVKGPAYLRELLQADEGEWADILRRKADSNEVSEASLLASVQRMMENTVLKMESGSYGQRVVAEYLKELEGRAKTLFTAIAGAK